MSSWDCLNFLYFVLPLCFVLRFYTQKRLNMDIIKRINPKGDYLNLENANALEQENQFLKKVIQEKDINIQKSEKLINELQAKIRKLELVKSELVNQLALENNNSKGMTDLMVKYEGLLSKIVNSELNTEENRPCSHMLEFEETFHDLMSKYQKAKTVIIGLEKNETELLNQITSYQKAMNQMKEQHDTFKKYAMNKLQEANEHCEKSSKEYLAETTKLKTKIIQSQHKINELEKSMARSKLTSSVLGNGIVNQSIFEPLVTNFK